MSRLLLALSLLPLLGMGWFPTPPKQRVLIQSAYCPVPPEMEMLMSGKWRLVIPSSAGLKPGDCVDFDYTQSVRLCCSVPSPRTCGAKSQPLAAAPVCKRVVTQ